MEKSVTIVFGSPKRVGYTGTVLDLLLEKIKTKKIYFFDSYITKATPCIDCNYCRTKEACQFSDLDDLDENLNLSDIIIFASPVYNLSFPASMKSIVDRFQRYYNAKRYLKIKSPIKKDTKSILLLTGGRNTDLSSSIMENQIKLLSLTINSDFIGKIFLSDTDNIKLDKNIIYSRVQEQINNIINKI